MPCQPPPKQLPLAVQLAFLGHRLVHLFDRRLSRHGLNRTQAGIIMALSRCEGMMAQHMVRPLHVRPASVTRALQGLERGGLISREGHPTDRRAMVVRLTTRGHEAADAIAGVLQAASTELEDSLTSAEVAMLRSALGSLFERLDRMKESEL